ncbi:hypothetical protein [Stanieria cyanosphaera]|uniref:hypothetical protein n=1 Tax=Stanieria cyanosphaera TaxID=102116 RepID=UPI001494A94D|nr:hypothetical protein [Stanieria cyanosphaera]
MGWESVGCLSLIESVCLSGLSDLSDTECFCGFGEETISGCSSLGLSSNIVVVSVSP